MFAKYTTLNELTYFSFEFAGLMTEKRNKWYQYFTICQVLISFTAFGSAAIELIFGSRKIQDVVGTLSSVVTAVCSIVRAMRFFARKQEIINLLNRLEVIRLKMLNDNDNKCFVIQAENVGRKILTGIFISLNGYPISSFIWVTVCNYLLDSEEYDMLHKIWVPWTWVSFWQNLFTNAVLAILSIPCLAFFAGIHFMEITFTLYVSAYIKSLQNNLINKGIKNKGIYEEHKVIIELIKEHNKILSGIKYFETQISPLMPCGFGYIFIQAIKKKEITKALDFYLRANLGLMPSIISCCCGQIVISQMENLHQATYMSKWYEEKVRVRKNFLTMMIRTTKTPAINYRLFVKFDHVLLGLVLQTVYSYLMLMINIDTGIK